MVGIGAGFRRPQPGSQGGGRGGESRELGIRQSELHLPVRDSRLMNSVEDWFSYYIKFFWKTGSPLVTCLYDGLTFLQNNKVDFGFTNR